MSNDRIPAAEVTRIEQAAEAFGKAMFTDAEFGLLLRLVLGEINDQENTNTERYCSDSAAAAWSRQLSRLRTVERKLRRQREALRASQSTETGQPDPAPREPSRREEAVGFMALGATERVMELLRSEVTHRTIAGLAHSAQVSRATVAKVIRRLEREGKLDVNRRNWPNGYLLKPEART